MLQRLFLKTLEEAYNHAVEVDSTGRTVVMTCDKPAAEFARDQVQKVTDPIGGCPSARVRCLPSSNLPRARHSRLPRIASEFRLEPPVQG